MIRWLTIFSFLSLISVKGMGQSSSVTLNVHLYPIQTLVVNPTQKEINLEYSTREDYMGGVVSEQPDHLTIYSTSGFQVKVNSNENLLNDTKSIPSNTVSIAASSGSKPIHQSSVTYIEKQLSTSEQPIIISSKGGIDRSFNINYKGAGADMYIDYYNAPDLTTTYSCNVIYTIVSQ